MPGTVTVDRQARVIAFVALLLVGVSALGCRPDAPVPVVVGGPSVEADLVVRLRPGVDGKQVYRLVREHLGVRWEQVRCGRPAASRGTLDTRPVVLWANYDGKATAEWRECMLARLAGEADVEAVLFNVAPESALPRHGSGPAAPAAARPNTER